MWCDMMWYDVMWCTVMKVTPLVNQSQAVKCSIGSWLSLSKGVYHEWEVPTILRMIPSFNIQLFIAFILFLPSTMTHISWILTHTQVDHTGECLDKTCIASQIRHSKTKWKDKQWHVWPGWGKQKLWKTVLKIQLQDIQCPNDSGHACKWVWQLNLREITI